MLTPQLACDLLVTALEGGSNYWLDTYQPHLSGYGNVINYAPDKTWTFAVDGESETVTTTWSDLQQALHKMPRHHLDNIKNDNWDAETADVWLQCALFGEIVYG